MTVPMHNLPGGNRLVHDYFDNFDKVAEFYNGDYRNPNVFKASAREQGSRKVPSPELASILKEQNQAYGCLTATLNNIDLLARGGIAAIVTGQQTGLLTGPIFTICKALTAIKLAESLNTSDETKFIPVFWLASDDHDFREINHFKIIGKDNQPKTLSYNGHSPDSKIPVSAINIDSSIESVISALAEGTHPSEFRDSLLLEVKSAYAVGTNFASAFAKMLTLLCSKFGLVIIDASDARIKALGRKLFHFEISDDSPSTKAALKTSATLQEQGYHNQVHLTDNFLNLFYVEEERASLQITDDTFQVKGQRQNFHKSELLSILESYPERFSPNVLLRPLYQDMLLPTVAYVAGPAETAYYAQMKGIYEAFKLPMPIIYPRKSMTLLEGKIEKVLNSYDLQVPDFWGNIETLINEETKKHLPDKLEARVENAGHCISKNMQALVKVVAEFDPTLVDFVKNSQDKMQAQIEGIEKKILQAYKKRNEVIQQQFHKAANNLYPNNVLQERELNITPFLFKYGLDFMQHLYDALDISNFEHQVVKI